MSAVLRLMPGSVRITLSPQAASDVVLAWLEGREAAVRLSRRQIESLAAAIEGTCPDCGGQAHNGDEVEQAVTR